MGDLRDPRLIYLKGVLFVVGGALASLGVLLEQPRWRVACLLAVAVWCFARAYYFAFYVIERYVDPSYRFAGLGSFAAYLWRRRRTRLPSAQPPAGERDLATLLRDMRPRLGERRYVFRTIADEQALPEMIRTARCVFREAEGVTVVLDDGQAGHLAAGEPAWAMITLEVHSDLQAVGFLAAITARLAAAGIAVNAVSAYRHDHLFVPWDRRNEAMGALRELSVSTPAGQPSPETDNAHHR